MTRIGTIVLMIILLAPSGSATGITESARHAPVTAAQAPEPSAAISTAPTEHPATADAVLPGVIGATDDQASTIEWAIGRYAEAGLDLPPLAIEVHPSPEGGQGNRGIYVSNHPVDIIHLCDVSTPVVLHELAHAWTAHHASPEVRGAFLAHEGLAHWSGATVPYDERGTERASQTMSLCLAERPLSDSDASRYGKYLEGYEILTGLPSPRLTP